VDGDFGTVSGNHHLGNSVRFLLGDIGRCSNGQVCTGIVSPTLLLHHVRQLMRQQPSTRRRGRRVSTRSKYDMAPHGVSVRLDSSSRLRCAIVGMDPHPAEVVTEARFHERPDG
jgi:hypothetical protein